MLFISHLQLLRETHTVQVTQHFLKVLFVFKDWSWWTLKNVVGKDFFYKISVPELYDSWLGLKTYDLDPGIK